MIFLTLYNTIQSETSVICKVRQLFRIRPSYFSSDRPRTAPSALWWSLWDCPVPPPTFFWHCPAIGSLQLYRVTFFYCCVNTTSPCLLQFQACNAGHAHWPVPPLCSLFGTASCHCTASHLRWPRRILNLTSGQRDMLTIDFETPCGFQLPL